MEALLKYRDVRKDALKWCRWSRTSNAGLLPGERAAIRRRVLERALEARGRWIEGVRAEADRMADYRTLRGEAVHNGRWARRCLRWAVNMRAGRLRVGQADRSTLTALEARRATRLAWSLTERAILRLETMRGWR